MEEMEIVSLRSFVEDGGACLTKLLSQVLARGMRTFRFPKVHTAEISEEFLKTLVTDSVPGIDSTQRGRDPP